MSSPANRTGTQTQRANGGDLASTPDVGELIRRLRRRQELSRTRLSDRVLLVSGDPAMNPDRLRRWEVGRDVPDAYWRGWLAMALGVPQDVLDRAAMITDGERRIRRRMQAAARGRSVRAGRPENSRD